MQVDYLIIGQGICGTMLSWFLEKEGRTYMVADNGNENTASRIAAGVINPVTGRRYALSWKIDELIPFALQTYAGLGEALDDRFIFEKSIIDFYPSPQMRLAFMDRMDAFADYLHAYPDQNHFNQDFQYEFGCGAIRPAYTIHLSTLLKLWRERLAANGHLLPGQVKSEEIIISEGLVRYKDITAGRVIFCEGIDAANNPWFSLLPFSANKGEALVIECPGLNREHIFKKGMLLVPLPQEDRFWTGASYEWEFEDAGPTAGFLKKTKALLDNWLKPPFRVVDHLAAIRPATLERRPFVGLHPGASEVGIFNGMGSKGSSLAPYFAHQFVQHLEYGQPLSPEVDVNRFSRILGRQ